MSYKVFTGEEVFRGVNAVAGDRGAYVKAVFDTLMAEFDPETANDLSMDIARCYGDMRQDVTQGNPGDMAAVVDSIRANAAYGDDCDFVAVEQTGDKAVVKINNCPFYARWQQLELTNDQCQSLCNIINCEQKQQMARMGFSYACVTSVTEGAPCCEMVIEAIK